METQISHLLIHIIAFRNFGVNYSNRLNVGYRKKIKSDTMIDIIFILGL